MFSKMSATRGVPVSGPHSKVAVLANFLRGATPDAAPARDSQPCEDSAFLSEPGGFESFGRGGLQLDGLHRDVQWVGAWGGRC